MNATATVEPAKRSFVRKIVNAEGAIEALQKMVKRRDEIEKRFNSVVDQAKRLQTEAAESWRAFLQDPSSVDIRKLAELRVQEDVVTEICALLYRRIPAAIDAAFHAEFGKELRKVLLAVAKHHFEQAQQRFDLELAHARDVLKAENFDDQAILESPRVRDASRQREKFEGLVARIKQSEDGRLWQFSADLLK